MWDTKIDIGDVDERLCSAVTHDKNVNNDFCSISHNRADFWITLYVLDVRLRVSKSSDVGKEIDRLLNARDVPTLCAFLLKATINVMDFKQIEQVHINMVKEYEDRGYKRAKAELRSWLAS